MSPVGSVDSSGVRHIFYQQVCQVRPWSVSFPQCPPLPSGVSASVRYEGTRSDLDADDFQGESCSNKAALDVCVFTSRHSSSRFWVGKEAYFELSKYLFWYLNDDFSLSLSYLRPCVFPVKSSLLSCMNGPYQFWFSHYSAFHTLPSWVYVIWFTSLLSFPMWIWAQIS